VVGLVVGDVTLTVGDGVMTPSSVGSRVPLSEPVHLVDEGVVVFLC
jgi:hypothetical protein